MRQYIGARYVPKFMGPYDVTQDYEALCIVDNGMGTSYISKVPTPAGTPLTDTNYWFVYGASSGAIINLQNQVDDLITHADYVFSTFDDIDDVVEGDIVLTRGFYSPADGGGSVYVVTSSATDLPSKTNTHGIRLQAISEPVNVLAFGCKINELSFDNSAILNGLFSDFPNCEFFAPSGNLHIDHTLVIPANFKGGVHFESNIHAYDMLDYSAVNILSTNANELYINGVYGNGSCDHGVLIGNKNMTDYTVNNTIIINRINLFTVGLKLEASNGYGTTNNKFYLRRIDNCDTGIEFEVKNSTYTEGFIKQNQFYNLWITGDGTNTKNGIVFTSTSNEYDLFDENNFENLSCEGCGSVVRGDSFFCSTFNNIRLGEQGPLNLPNLFVLGSHCRHNKFTSNAPRVDYTNISDAGEYNIYDFKFYDPVSTNELGNSASFRNSRFMLKGECLTNKVVNVGSETDKTIDPFRSVSFINVNRIVATPVDITLPNNAKESNYAPTLVIKLNQIGGGVRIKDVDGNVLASSDGSGGTALSAGHVYLYYVNWNHSVSINEIV